MSRRPPAAVDLDVAQAQIRELFRRLEAIERQMVAAIRPTVPFPLLRDTPPAETGPSLRLVKGGGRGVSDSGP